MTREEFARRIGWERIIWIAGLVNVIAMLPQLVQIVRTWKVDGLSLEMIWIYFVIQIAFSLQGFFRRDRMLMVCLGLSALVSATILGLAYVIRYGGLS